MKKKERSIWSIRCRYTTSQ